MDIRNVIPGRRTRREIEAMRGDIVELRTANKLQAQIINDITTATAATAATYSGNVYKTYASVIKALAEKYEGKAEWGVLQTGNIIDVRAAFIIGQGLVVLPKDAKDKAERQAFMASPEYAFIQDFIDWNNLDREMAQELAKEAEIEGCALFELVPVDDEGETRVTLQFMSRVDKSYTITTAPKDYLDYIEASWTPSRTSVPEVLTPERFVYGRFGGRVHKPNEPYPKVGKCLTEIEGLSKALRDWQEISRLFASPTPVIECEDKASADEVNTEIKNKTFNFKAKKLLVLGNGKLVYVQPNLADGAEALGKLIETYAKMISGTTGVPVHFLGLPDLMSNRATADNLMELVSASTRKERQIWIGIYEEIIRKAIAIRNANAATTPLDPDTFKIEIPYVTEEAWQRIVDVYLPLYESQAISLDTLLAQIPGVDAEAELEKAEEREAKALERFNAQADKGDEDEDEDEEDEEEEPRGRR